MWLGTAWVCRGESTDGYEARLSETERRIEAVEAVVDGLIERKNLIVPAELATELRYSPGQGRLIVDKTGNYGCTGLIAVEEGEMYTYSGSAAVMSGAYFAADATFTAGTPALAEIAWFEPVSGAGHCFTVPVGRGVKFVCLAVRLSGERRQIEGTLQLERGEMATDISDYVIAPSRLPTASEKGKVLSLDALPAPCYGAEEMRRIAKFRRHWINKDKDLVMVGTGTSLTARGAEHCTLRRDAAGRPPLFDSNNFASLIWDRVKWEGQQYRRYDYGNFFTETGDFQTSASLEEWDDANFHNAWTRYADNGASVQFTVPENAWQFNFIYRADMYGSEDVAVTVAEGDGEMLAWNGSEWVEANGYRFSMRETPVVMDEVSVPHPRRHDENIVIKDFQVGGNTTFQRRLKMKAIHRNVPKTVTVSASSGRLLYWGVEWSPREFMITYVNSALGSHNITVNHHRALQRTQDNMIWSFKPDLIFTENPIHNSGAGGVSGFEFCGTSFWRDVTYDFFFNGENPVSLVSRAKANGIEPDELEWIVFNSSLSLNFGGIDANGELLVAPNRDGRMLTALDAQMISQDCITETGRAVSINACKYWCDAAVKLFGDLKSATAGSGKNGSTFTNEGSHWNDTGSRVMDRCVGPVFNFY